MAFMFETRFPQQRHALAPRSRHAADRTTRCYGTRLKKHFDPNRR